MSITFFCNKSYDLRAIVLVFLASAMALRPCSLMSAESTAADTMSSRVSRVAVCDTVANEYRFKARQLILPTVLITAGAVGVSNPSFLDFKAAVSDGAANIRGERNFEIEDYIQYLPLVAHLGLGFTGVKARNPFRERILAAATASLVMGAVVKTLKYTVSEYRPYTDIPSSFPSGHTAIAFMGAELIRHEYPLGISIGAYSVAILTGALRIYNDRHWANDVIAGAGIGILSARIGYWMLPVYRRWFGWDRAGRQPATAFSALPTYDYMTHSVGIAASMTF